MWDAPHLGTPAALAAPGNHDIPQRFLRPEAGVEPFGPWFRPIFLVNGDYPLVNIQKAIENGPFIVDLPIKNGDFPLLC